MPRRPHHNTRRPRTPLTAAAVAALALTALWGGCSIEKNYEVLSLFFDGVPDPDAAAEGRRSGAGAGAETARVVLSAHSAYAERRCGDCHGQTSDFGFRVSGFSTLDAGVCAKCHADTRTEYAYVHGPVASGACLWCHQAHESTYPLLLASPSPKLCLDCHQFHLSTTPRIPEHQDLDRDCLGCHRGHGGDDRYFLKPWTEAPPEPPAEPGAAGSQLTADSAQLSLE